MLNALAVKVAMGDHARRHLVRLMILNIEVP